MGGASAQSLFGGGAHTVMTKITGVVGGLFMVTCLSLAALSTVQGRSVVEQLPAVTSPELPLPGIPAEMPATTPVPDHDATPPPAP